MYLIPKSFATEFFITDFFIAEFVIYKIVITEFVITKFVITDFFSQVSRVNSNSSNRVMERYEKICDLGEGSQVNDVTFVPVNLTERFTFSEKLLFAH